MTELAKHQDGQERLLEVAGKVYHEARSMRTPVTDLDGLMGIPWLDPETAESIYNDYLKPKYSGPIVVG